MTTKADEAMERIAALDEAERAKPRVAKFRKGMRVRLADPFRKAVRCWNEDRGVHTGAGGNHIRRESFDIEGRVFDVAFKGTRGLVVFGADESQSLWLDADECVRAAK